MIEVKNVQPQMDLRGYGTYGLYGDLISGQVNVTHTQPGIIRAFHWHKQQTDHWFCIKGNIHVVLIESEENLCNISESYGFYTDKNDNLIAYEKIYRSTPHATIGKVHHYYIGEKNPQVLKIPPGVIHGFAPMYNEEATLLYYTDKKYDPEDELRLSYDFIGGIWDVENK